MNLPFKCICINDSDKPDGIPTSKWVKRGQEYIVIEVAKLNLQGGKLGFRLQELDITECFPYQFFASSRFAIPMHPDNRWAEQELARLMKEVKEETLNPSVPV
jgi:hypothetical protein